MKRVLVFGDSNSWGYTDQDNGHRYEKRWPVLLNQELIQKGFNIEIIEDCLPGRTTNIDDLQDGIHLNGAKVLKSSLLSHSPIDFVIILLGTNDLKVRFQRSAENIADGIKELIQIIFETNSGTGSWHDQNKSKLVIICPPFLGEKSNDPSWLNFDEWVGGLEKSKQLYYSFEKVCSQMGVDLIDANQFCQSSNIDPIHWSKPMHQKFSENLAKILEQKINLTQLIKINNCESPQEIIDFFTHRFLNVPLDKNLRKKLIFTLENQLGTDQINITNVIDIEQPLRTILHLILSLPEYQLS